MKRFNRIGLIVTLFAVALMMAGPALACPVSVGSFAAPSFAVAQPQAVYQSSVGVSCGQAVAAVADPQVVVASPMVSYQAAPLLLAAPVYSQAVFASPFVSVYGSSFVGSRFVGAHVGIGERLREHGQVRREARAAHAAIRAQR
jgi:hypothetical protein